MTKRVSWSACVQIQEGCVPFQPGSQIPFWEELRHDLFCLCHLLVCTYTFTDNENDTVDAKT